MPARGRYSRRQNKKQKNNPRRREHTTGTHNIVAATKRSIHPLTAVQQNVGQQ